MQGNGNNRRSTNNQKQLNRSSILESLADIPSHASKSIQSDLVSPLPQEALSQLLGKPVPPRPEKRNMSAEIFPGESLEVKDVLSGQHEENKKLKLQIALERRIRDEEKVQLKKKERELKIMIHKLAEEVVQAAKATDGLSTEVEKAAMYAPSNPGIYHVIFFEKLISFLRSFRKKIQQADQWLHANNQRAAKKNYWSMYQKHGGKFLLSGEHYSGRSAG